MGRDKGKQEQPAKGAAQAKPAGGKTKHRKHETSRKRAPAQRLQQTLARFAHSTAATKVEQGRLEALQHQAVRERGSGAAKNQAELADLLSRTKVRPLDPKKLARQLMPNARF